MARYQYAGPGPHDLTMVGGGIVRPGDIAEFDDLPGYGPWELLEDEPDPPAPVPVKEQIAAGIPPEETVTIAAQKAGTPPPPPPASGE